jgi:adenosylmethionine-8-amino-7-oxononanoate aminotransferase
VTGASGVVVAPDNYFGQVQKLLTKYDIMLWADEVICGFGRTGNDFGSTTMKLKPQLMSLAKQLSSAYIPISASIIPGAMYEAMIEQSASVGVFGHGYTYTGHPVACAAALKTLEIFERDKLFEHAARMGEYLHQQLQQFQSHPLVGEIRGVGLIAAVELVANKMTGEAFADGSVGAATIAACLSHGLSLRAVAGNSIAFCPPLIISKSQIDEMISLFGKGLNDALEFAQKENLLKP